MNDQSRDESIVQIPRDPFSDAILSQNADDLAQFMEEPLTAIAESITGWLASGPKAWTVSAGHIVQAMLKGRLFEEVSREIKELRDKGKISEDYAETKYGFQSWVELFRTIDDEVPDADKLEALKAMFYSVNKIGAFDNERILNYQLFQIARRLSSNQLLILKVANESRSQFGQYTSNGRITWAGTIAARLGHNLLHLVIKEESALAEHGLIDQARQPTDQFSDRLTSLGDRFCENIQKYHIETGK